MAKRGRVEAGITAELQKIGLDTIDGSAVQESASGVGMVVVAAADSVVQVNGATLTSSKTSLNVNGLSLDLMDVTDGEVSITVSDDTDAVYDSIKEFVTQYNSILKEMNTLYNAESARNYDVLTDDQKDAMSDEEVEKWNTKIKDSLLRRDSTLDGLITTMRSITGQIDHCFEWEEVFFGKSWYYYRKQIIKSMVSFILKEMRMIRFTLIQRIRCRIF